MLLQLATLQRENEELYKKLASVEPQANDILRAVDRHRVAIFSLTSEAQGLRLSQRELDVLESGTDELEALAATLFAPWRDGQVGSIALP